MTITIDLDTILDRIYADSAWHAAYETDIKVLTPDNARKLEMSIEDGLADLRLRLAGYINAWNYNPFLDKGNITIGLALPATMDCHTATVHDTIVDLLANYALLRHYGDEGTHFGLAWRTARARIMLLMARAQ